MIFQMIIDGILKSLIKIFQFRSSFLFEVIMGLDVGIQFILPFLDDYMLNI